MPKQLRIYTINKHQLETFAEEWQRQLKPLRESLGFSIPSAYLNKETNQFIWILSYNGNQNWNELDQRYHQSNERKTMQPDPARNIARVEKWFIKDLT